MQQARQGWEARLDERLGSAEWTDTDPVFASLPPDEALRTLHTLLDLDHQRLRYGTLISLVSFVLQVVLVPLLFYFVVTSTFVRWWPWGAFLLAFVPILTSVGPRPGKRAMERSWRRCRNAYAAIQKRLPECRTAETVPALFAFLQAIRRTPRALHQELEMEIHKTLARILSRLSGDEVFALPFSLRSELARFAEQPEVFPDLAISILLALTSARDGLAQPVLRRLARDGRSVRLKQAAAECLAEFGLEEA